MNNFTPRAQQVLALSRKEADNLHHNYVGTEHLLLGLIRLGQGVAVNVLQKQGLDLETVRIEVEKQVGAGPAEKISGNIPYTPRVKKVLALAAKEAKALNHSYVGTEHILLGLLREGDGVSCRVLKTLGVDIERTRVEVLAELDPYSIDPSSPAYRDVNRIVRELGSTSKVVGYIPEQPVSIGTPAENVHPAFRKYLNPEETLLWDGVPLRRFRFGQRHFPLVFFLLAFLAFILASASSPTNPPKDDSSKAVPGQTQTAVDHSSTPSTEKPSRPFPVFILIFFGLFMLGIVTAVVTTFGGLMGLGFSSKSTLYGITNLRLIVITGKHRKTVRSFFLGSFTDIRMEEWPDGLGTISFGANLNWPYTNSFGNRIPAIENIAFPAKVFQLIAQARQKL